MQMNNRYRPINTLISLNDRKSLVIGGCGHIGSMVVETLCGLGSNVVLIDLPEKEPSTCAGQFNTNSSNIIHGLACDLTDESSTRNSVRSAIKIMNGLDILVHCAGYVGTSEITGWNVPFEEQTAKSFNQGLQINLTSAFITVQEASKSLSVSQHSSIILFSSIYGINGPDLNLYNNTNMSNPMGYGASKGGLLQLMRYLATTLAPNTRVNTISPGGILRGQPEVFQARYVTKTPLRRLATEEDLSGAVAYLASDMSSYVTGLNLVVDGGWTTW